LQIIDLLPYGGIEHISKKLNKDRGTVRGVLQGKWYNEEIISACLEIIESDLNNKSQILTQFKNELDNIQSKYK